MRMRTSLLPKMLWNIREKKMPMMPPRLCLAPVPLTAATTKQPERKGGGEFFATNDVTYRH